MHAALLAITVYNDIQLLCSYLQLLCIYIQLLCNHSLKFKSQKVSVDYSAASLLGARSLCNSGSALYDSGCDMRHEFYSCALINFVFRVEMKMLTVTFINSIFIQ